MFTLPRQALRVVAQNKEARRRAAGILGRATMGKTVGRLPPRERPVRPATRNNQRSSIGPSTTPGPIGERRAYINPEIEEGEFQPGRFRPYDINYSRDTSDIDVRPLQVFESFFDDESEQEGSLTETLKAYISNQVEEKQQQITEFVQSVLANPQEIDPERGLEHEIMGMISTMAFQVLTQIVQNSPSEIDPERALEHELADIISGPVSEFYAEYQDEIQAGVRSQLVSMLGGASFYIMLTIGRRLMDTILHQQPLPSADITKRLLFLSSARGVTAALVGNLLQTSIGSALGIPLAPQFELGLTVASGVISHGLMGPIQTRVMSSDASIIQTLKQIQEQGYVNVYRHHLKSTISDIFSRTGVCAVPNKLVTIAVGGNTSVFSALMITLSNGITNVLSQPVDQGTAEVRSDELRRQQTGLQRYVEAIKKYGVSETRPRTLQMLLTAFLAGSAAYLIKQFILTQKTEEESQAFQSSVDSKLSQIDSFRRQIEAILENHFSGQPEEDAEPVEPELEAGRSPDELSSLEDAMELFWLSQVNQ